MTEIFLQPELEELIIDADKKAEWEEKIVSLGLDGQLELTKNSPKNSASPYTFMNRQMRLVFETLCPSKAEVKQYKKSVIPIEVLSHIALCTQERYFAKMQIWYDDKAADPVLVGALSNTYNPDLHIVARWGDEIIPYEQLIEKAISRYTEQYKIALERLKVSVDTCQKEAELNIKQLFAGQKEGHQIEPRFQVREFSFL